MSVTADMIFGPEISGASSAAIGAFDGIHLGHRHILRETAAYAKEKGISSAAVLFDPLPSVLFGRLAPDQRILLPEEQKAILTELGITHTVVIPFTREIAALSPEAFLEAMQQKLHCEKLFMGEDFSLGKGRSGTAPLITKIGNDLGFSTEVFPKDVMDGEVISSTRIRALLSAGRVTEANRLLGYPFFFSGCVIHGEARGRKIGYPTLNTQIPEGKIRLPNGVYAVNVLIEGEKHPAVTNVGVRPTFGLEAKGISVESHLLNTAGNFYGDTARLEFISMLREEVRFGSAEELRDQIARDIEKARQILL